MKRLLRRPEHLRNGRVWMLILSFFVVSGIIVTFERNDHPSSPFKSQPPSLSSGNALPQKAASPAAIKKGAFRIVIDPGHGGDDPGAEGVSGREEKAFNLALSAKIYETLKQEPMFEPYLTRSDDTFVGLVDRAMLANDLKAAAFISIHGNSFKNSNIQGAETYYCFDHSIDLAQILHQRLTGVNGLKDRGIRQRPLKVLFYSTMPAVLLEAGYLTNSSDESAMNDGEWQTREAEAIVDGLKEYFRVS